MVPQAGSGGHGLAVFLFPPVLSWVYGHELLAAWSDPGALLNQPVVFGYLTLCWFTALVYLSIVTFVRSRRRSPDQVVSCRGEIEDVAKHLGEMPIGNGKYWRLARLPRNECFHVECRDLTLRFPRLPEALSGLTILHITDLHFCGSPAREYYQRVFDLCLATGPPDILAITGDVVDSAHHHKWIVPLMGRLKWRIAAFAILGNHDLYHEPVLVRRRLRRIGVRVLGNDWQQIEVRGTPLIVIGNESPWFRPAPVLPPINDQGGNGAFRLCLSHTPDNFRWAQRNRVDLMLAGHVHGGQVRLPGIGPLFVPSRFCRRYDCGHSPEGQL